MLSSSCRPGGTNPGLNNDEAPSILLSRAVLALLLAGILCGCATTSPKAYPYFDRLAIEALPTAPFEKDEALSSPGELMAAGAVVGGSGALSAGLVGSLVCGPYFLVCLAGTGAAVLGGAAAGAVMAGSTALSAEEAEQVARQLESLQRSHDLGEELAMTVSDRLPAARLSPADSTDAHLGLEVQGLRVATGFNDTIALWVAVKAGLEWTPDGKEMRQTSRTFACQAESVPVDEWLKGEKAGAERALAHCIDDLALQIQTALQGPRTNPDAESASLVGFGHYDPAVDGW